jgi:hypothetical protein
MSTEASHKTFVYKPVLKSDYPVVAGDQIHYNAQHAQAAAAFLQKDPEGDWHGFTTMDFRDNVGLDQFRHVLFPGSEPEL